MSFPILELILPQKLLLSHPRLSAQETPEHCVICFFKEVIEKVVDQHHVKMLVRNAWKMVHTFDLRDRTSGKATSFLSSWHRIAIAAATLEEAYRFCGCRKFIACGGCGVLAPDIAVGQLVVLSGAIRDEGASYHYLPPAHR